MNTHVNPEYVGSISYNGMNCHCVGELRREEQVIYLSMVGYRTANKALWAALMESRNALQIGSKVLARRMPGQYLHDEKPLPDIGMANMILLHHQASVLHNEPNMEFYVLCDVQHTAIEERFFAMLNRAVSLPMRPEWTHFMMDWGSRNGVINPIRGKGITGFSVNPDADYWMACIKEGIRKGKLA